MTHDHSNDNHVNTAGHDDHGHDDQGSHDDHGHGHDRGVSDASTLVPTTWRQLIFPALILILVGILLIGPISAAFAPRPAVPTTEETVGEGEGEGITAEESPEAEPIVTSTTVSRTATTVPAEEEPGDVEATVESVAPTATLAPSANQLATRTAVAVAGREGNVTRAPEQLEFAGTRFSVVAGGEVLPDWKTTAEAGRAVWITGTFANHVIYLPYTATNAALFAKAKSDDVVKLVMDTGQTFEFRVTRSERALNGPPSTEGEFTTATAMNQDHAGVTLFLVGDPASDRAVVQADFTGNIQ